MLGCSKTKVRTDFFLQLILFEHLRIWLICLFSLCFYEPQWKKRELKFFYLVIFYPPDKKSLLKGGRKHLFSVDTPPVSLQHSKAACVFFFFFFVAFVCFSAVVLFYKYCVTYPIPTHQFIWVHSNLCFKMLTLVKNIL